MKAIREKRVVTYKEIPIRPWADFSTETFQARSKWDDAFKILGGGGGTQPRNLYPPGKAVLQK